MADMSPSRPGQINGAGDVDALFLKVFAGEVLKAFDETNVFAARTMTRSISAGKSAQFPATWKAAARYHTPGTQIVGQSLLSNERVVTIDDVLISDVFIASIDEAKSHFEFRSEYSKQTGRALARAYDKNVAQVALLAARASATITGGNGGTKVVAATAKTNADALIAAISDSAQALDEKDVPKEDRVVFVKPDQFYLMINSGSRAIHRDYNPAGNGSLADGTLPKLFGMPLVVTNNLPQSNVTTGPAAYQGDFTNTAALVMHKGAVGTVKLLDVAVESEYLIQYQGTLIVSKYAVGHGILRPECSVEIATA